jgi:Uma2 family endonuclease
MAIQSRLYTAEDLQTLPSEGKRYELVEGHLIEMSPTGEIHGLLVARLLIRLGVFVEQGDLGRVYGAETGFRLAKNPDTVVGIDVAFVSKARLKPATEEYFSGAPDLAVEVVSPGNTKTEMHDKVKAYFRAGARLVWMLYPKSRVVYVYISPTDISVLEGDNVLSGGNVLPGFTLKISDLFAVLDS